jgi:hypothetical protein
MSAVTYQQNSCKPWLKDLCIQSNTCQASSTELIKRLFAACISNITYLRAIFDEDCYIEQYFGDIKVKMLNEASTDYGVQQHIKWIKGTFEALENQYLKHIIYIVYTDKDNPNGSIIEMYKVSVTYAEVDPSSFNLTNKTNKTQDGTEKSFYIPHLNLEEFKTKTKNTFNDVQKMLLTLGMIADELEDFPEKTYFTMKLKYNQRTPKNYNPSGFSKEIDTKPISIKDNNKICINMGESVTNYHSLKLKASYDTRIIGKQLKKSKEKNVNFEETINEKTNKSFTEIQEHTLNSTRTSNFSSTVGTLDISNCSLIKKTENLDLQNIQVEDESDMEDHHIHHSKPHNISIVEEDPESGNLNITQHSEISIGTTSSRRSSLKPSLKNSINFDSEKELQHVLHDTHSSVNNTVSTHLSTDTLMISPIKPINKRCLLGNCNQSKHKENLKEIINSEA